MVLVTAQLVCDTVDEQNFPWYNQLRLLHYSSIYNKQGSFRHQVNDHPFIQVRLDWASRSYRRIWSEADPRASSCDGCGGAISAHPSHQDETLKKGP